MSAEGPIAFKDARLIADQRDGDVVGGIQPTDQIAGVIHDLIHVAEFIPGSINEAIARLRSVIAMQVK